MTADIGLSVALEEFYPRSLTGDRELLPLLCSTSKSGLRGLTNN